MRGKSWDCMDSNSTPPWATGPGEILRHGTDLLQQDSDVNRRLAMISIDNAVELMIKTYLGLPRRITGLLISRREYEDFSQTFPKLLDAAEKFAAEKLTGINLGEIEWYHRLRNELYHQGNGLTVEREKVEVYAALANLLFENLFGFRLIESSNDSRGLLGDFMAAWIDLERSLGNLCVDTEKPKMLVDGIRLLAEQKIISKAEIEEIQNLRLLRNNIAHGMTDYSEVLTADKIARLKQLASEINSRCLAIGRLIG